MAGSNDSSLHSEFDQLPVKITRGLNTGKWMSILNHLKNGSHSEQVMALTELSNVLSYSNEDYLLGFPALSYIRVLFHILEKPNVKYSKLFPESKEKSSESKEKDSKHNYPYYSLFSSLYAEDKLLMEELYKEKNLEESQSHDGQDSKEGVDESEMDLDEEVDAEYDSQVFTNKMILSATCLNTILDIVPYTSRYFSMNGNLTTLCNKLSDLEYIDLAERILLIFEKLSHEIPLNLLRKSVLEHMLMYIDFFPMDIQISTLSCALNVVRLADSKEYFSKYLVPILNPLCSFFHSDSKKLVEVVISIWKELLGILSRVGDEETVSEFVSKLSENSFLEKLIQLILSPNVARSSVLDYMSILSSLVQMSTEMVKQFFQFDQLVNIRALCYSQKDSLQYMFIHLANCILSNPYDALQLDDQSQSDMDRDSLDSDEDEDKNLESSDYDMEMSDDSVYSGEKTKEYTEVVDRDQFFCENVQYFSVIFELLPIGELCDACYLLTNDRHKSAVIGLIYNLMRIANKIDKFRQVLLTSLSVSKTTELVSTCFLQVELNFEHTLDHLLGILEVLLNVFGNEVIVTFQRYGISHYLKQLDLEHLGDVNYTRNHDLIQLLVNSTDYVGSSPSSLGVGMMDLSQPSPLGQYTSNAEGFEKYGSTQSDDSDLLFEIRSNIDVWTPYELVRNVPLSRLSFLKDEISLHKFITTLVNQSFTATHLQVLWKAFLKILQYTNLYNLTSKQSTPNSSCAVENRKENKMSTENRVVEKKELEILEKKEKADQVKYEDKENIDYGKEGNKTNTENREENKQLRLQEENRENRGTERAKPLSNMARKEPSLKLTLNKDNFQILGNLDRRNRMNLDGMLRRYVSSYSSHPFNLVHCELKLRLRPNYSQILSNTTNTSNTSNRECNSSSTDKASTTTRDSSIPDDRTRELKEEKNVKREDNEVDESTRDSMIEDKELKNYVMEMDMYRDIEQEHNENRENKDNLECSDLEKKFKERRKESKMSTESREHEVSENRDNLGTDKELREREEKEEGKDNREDQSNDNMDKDEDKERDNYSKELREKDNLRIKDLLSRSAGNSKLERRENEDDGKLLPISVYVPALVRVSKVENYIRKYVEKKTGMKVVDVMVYVNGVCVGSSITIYEALCRFGGFCSKKRKQIANQAHLIKYSYRFLSTTSNNANDTKDNRDCNSSSTDKASTTTKDNVTSPVSNYNTPISSIFSPREYNVVTPSNGVNMSRSVFGKRLFSVSSDSSSSSGREQEVSENRDNLGTDKELREREEKGKDNKEKSEKREYKEDPELMWLKVYSLYKGGKYNFRSLLNEFKKFNRSNRLNRFSRCYYERETARLGSTSLPATGVLTGMSTGPQVGLGPSSLGVGMMDLSQPSPLGQYTSNTDGFEKYGSTQTQENLEMMRDNSTVANTSRMAEDELVENKMNTETNYLDKNSLLDMYNNTNENEDYYINRTTNYITSLVSQSQSSSSEYMKTPSFSRYDGNENRDNYSKEKYNTGEKNLSTEVRDYGKEVNKMSRETIDTREEKREKELKEFNMDQQYQLESVRMDDAMDEIDVDNIQSTGYQDDIEVENVEQLSNPILYAKIPSFSSTDGVNNSRLEYLIKVVKFDLDRMNFILGENNSFEDILVEVAFPKFSSLLGEDKKTLLRTMMILANLTYNLDVEDYDMVNFGNYDTGTGSGTGSGSRDYVGSSPSSLGVGMMDLSQPSPLGQYTSSNNSNTNKEQEQNGASPLNSSGFNLSSSTQLQDSHLNHGLAVSTSLSLKVLSACSELSTSLCLGLEYWVQFVLCCPQIFSLRARMILFRMNTIGLSRNLCEYFTRLRNMSGEGVGDAFDEYLLDYVVSNRVRLVDEEVKLPKVKLNLDRNNLLEDAMKGFEKLSTNQKLDIEYRNEVGIGSGPTLEFYSLISETFSEFQEPKLLEYYNGYYYPAPHMVELGDEEGLLRKLMYGYDTTATTNYSNSSGGTSNRECNSSSTNKTSTTTKDNNNNDFSPTTVPSLQRNTDVDMSNQMADQLAEKLFKLYSFLGKVFAYALLDEKLFDLFFHPLFWNLVKYPNKPLNLTLDTLRQVDPNLADSLQQIKNHPNPSQLYLTHEYQGYELFKGGSEVYVDSNNVEQYVQMMVNFRLFEGIKLQVWAFRYGFSSQLPLYGLWFFTDRELSELIFGNMRNQHEFWTMEHLKSYIVPDHGYDSNSTVYNDLISILHNFNENERRLFLKFTTGASILPKHGFKSLVPLMRVVKKGNVDELPSVMTCTNYLKMPNYKNPQVMRDKLVKAIYEGQNAFNLS